MAATKKKKTSASRSAAQASAAANRQLNSVLLFAGAVFLACVVFIKGQFFWTIMHNFIFSVFGVTAYFYPFLLGFVAVMYALDRCTGTIGAKIAESAALVMLIGSCVDIFALGKKYDAAKTFGTHIDFAFKNGSYKNGGFFGALIGHPLYHTFGKTGALITVFLLIFVFLMIITGTTLIVLFRSLARPVQSISEQAGSAYQARAEREAQQPVHGKKQLKVMKDFNVDMPVDDIPEKRRSRASDPSLDERQRKLISTYNDEEMPAPARKTAHTAPKSEPESPVQPAYEAGPELPAGAGDKRKMDAALKAAEEEKRAAEEKKAAEEEKITKAEIAEATSQITADITGGMTVTDEESYRFPPLTLLKEPKFENGRSVEEELDNTAEHLVETLRSFGVETRIVDICRGPTVTRYELQPCAGVKISKITNLADDIALNLASAGVRIEAPIPNKAAVGIEVPNKSSATVGVREIIESPAFTSSKSKLTIALGRDIAGNVVVGDIAKMPHGLIAGATGSGKSVCINSIIMSILYKANPDEVKLLMIDPKVVELGVYNGIPHLLVPVVTEPRKAAGALGWAVSEMEKRYQMFADRGVRDIAGYNKFVDTLTDEPEVTKMPHIVIIIDELADLMMTAPNEVEDSINRIAAKARAAGMHLLIATQRPSVDVVTGVIKANIPSRIAFAVSSQIDSRTILDMGGAEKLLGRGDMLFSPVGSTKPNRVQGCFVSDEEVEAVVDFIKNGGSADYDDNIMVEIERQAAVEKQKKTGLPEDGPDEDPMLQDAVKVVVEAGQASTSLLQRKLKLGYARAARVIDQLEERGVVGPYEGSKPRKVLITEAELMEREVSED